MTNVDVSSGRLPNSHRFARTMKPAYHMRGQHCSHTPSSRADAQLPLLPMILQRFTSECARLRGLRALPTVMRLSLGGSGRASSESGVRKVQRITGGRPSKAERCASATARYGLAIETFSSAELLLSSTARRLTLRAIPAPGPPGSPGGLSRTGSWFMAATRGVGPSIAVACVDDTGCCAAVRCCDLGAD